jgi:hypothetical protein
VLDKHRSGDGPAEEEITVLTVALVSEDAMGAFLDPDDDILATTRLEEAHADTKKSFADTKVVTTNRAAMKHRHNDEQKRSARLETLPDNKATMMNAEVVISCELLESRLKAQDDGGAPFKV